MNSVNERLESVKNDMLEVKSLLDATKYMNEEQTKEYIERCCKALLSMSLEINGIKSQVNDQRRDLQKVIDGLM